MASPAGRLGVVVRTASNLWISNPFSRYSAEGMGCTTFSFGVNLGIQFMFISTAHWSTNNAPPTDRLKNHHCYLRGKLTKSPHQPQLPRDDVWYIDAAGSNLLFVLADVRENFRQRGLPWFERFASLWDVLRCLREEEVSEEWFGPGALDSPDRRWHTGHVARAVGEDRLADQLIADAESELRADPYANLASAEKKASVVDHTVLASPCYYDHSGVFLRMRSPEKIENSVTFWPTSSLTR